MTTRSRKGDVNYQARALAFHVGDTVFPLFGKSAVPGVVVSVFPAIGMVDVQFPHGASRYPVEDLILEGTTSPENALAAVYNSVPGGTGVVPVSGGPPLPKTAASTPVLPPPTPPKVSRVAAAYVKKAVYWANVDRKYKPSREELSSGQLCCPRCEDAFLRKTVYKREEGKSVKLFCCPKCLFLLRRDDVIGMEG